MSRYRKRISSSLSSPEDKEIHAKIHKAHRALLEVMDTCRVLEKKAAFGMEKTRVKRTMRDTARALGALEGSVRLHPVCGPHGLCVGSARVNRAGQLRASMELSSDLEGLWLMEL